MIYNACTLLIYYAGSALLFLAFSTLRLVQLLPFAQWIVFGLMNKIATIQMPREDYWHSLFTWPMFTSMRSSILLELQKLATRGNLAPDSHLISVDGKSRCSLLELCRGNRPLVVNFCSWTCPIFRARVGEFLSIVREFSDVADFLTVYVEEAHPSDGWAFKNNVTIPRHQTLEQRCDAAQLMLDSVEFNCPVMVDNMENGANKAYAGLPIRLYIIKGQHIEYAGGAGPTFYNPKEVKQWLQSTRTPLKNTRHRA
ncbi:thyroxine 5'-deiodinase [Desmophyllum pertusum]|uniref:Iodothyronine deiodinase n=1 Tax=Desmophyllum pertusum TaxID=174260 RepID=A0A9X0CDD4_9CNID|nr:thyroxine 5'-deiodinase [Desmophyllum pertusum]